MTSFPRQQARTRRFTLGVPRSFTTGTGPDGPVVLFLRSDGGEDPVTHLWRHDPTTGGTRRLVDARTLAVDDAELPAEERARRERAREQAGGIVAYATDERFTLAAFALAGRLFTVDLATAEVVEQPSEPGVFDPRPSPDGRRVAYHAGDGLHVVDLDDGPSAVGTTRTVVVEPGVGWGRAEFVAAEEMGRSRGFWWSDDGTRLAVARVDERAVPVWTIADPAHPERPPVAHRYPAAGTTNAEVSLWVVDAVDGTRIEVATPDGDATEYLAHVAWGAEPLTVLWQSRDQRTAEVRTVDAATGATTLVRRLTDDAWVEPVPGTPAWAGGQLVTVEDLADRGYGGTRTLCLDGAPVTPPGLQVREVTHVSDHLVAFLASAEEPTEVHAYRQRVGTGHGGPDLWSVTEGSAGVHREVAGSRPEHPWVRVSHTLGRPHPEVVASLTIATGERVEHPVEVVAATPVLTARPRMLALGPRKLRAALLLPSDDDGTSPLPVLLDPYGGPHAQRVVQAGGAHLTSQWLADQGFAVLVVDGRGSPGRGPAWERALHRDLAGPVLDDQLTALGFAARVEPRLDLDRVAIRGWSFGGYLAALAVLRRPDVVRVAIAGAPVTSWARYDTHYTERYLGHPSHDPDAYERSDLVDAQGQLLGAVPWDADDPPQLLLIHGLADDNVVAAHSLELSTALLADGRPHGFLPLTGVTHMTPQEVVAEQLLHVQVRLLRQAFGLG